MHLHPLFHQFWTVRERAQPGLAGRLNAFFKGLKQLLTAESQLSHGLHRMALLVLILARIRQLKKTIFHVVIEAIHQFGQFTGGVGMDTGKKVVQFVGLNHEFASRPSKSLIS